METKKPTMKLKLTTKPTPTAEALQAQTPLTTPGGGPRLKFNLGPPQTPVAAEASADGNVAKKAKRKYTPRKPKDSNAPEASAKGSKKRPRNENEEDASANAPSKKKASESTDRPTGLKLRINSFTTPSQSIETPGTATSTSSLKVRLPNRPTLAPRIAIKHQGKPPPRPLGVGYDSEREDAEIDPAVESQFILRMQPGPDCDLLRRAIEERKIGIPKSQGGLDIFIRFYDKEARRAMVHIEGRMYAASMLDLPCVIESMKSWEKKGQWWKSADICQILLVLGKVPNEDAAKSFPLPREVNQKVWQYPHGLTPPMHYVRKRRFRQRVDYRTIEAVEDEVERLLAADEEAKESGGITDYSVLDPDQMRDEDHDDSMDGEGESDVEGGHYPMGDEVDDEEEMRKLMEQEFGVDDEPTAHDVALHALGSDSNAVIPTTETATPTASGETETEEDDDSEDDDDDVDEETRAAQQEEQQQREEIAELEADMQSAIRQMESITNPLLRTRLAAKVKNFKDQLELKKASFGSAWEE